MVDFTRSAATAQRLIEKNGRQVTVYKSNRAPDDTDQPWRGSSSRPNAGKGGAQIPVIVAFVPAQDTGAGSVGFGKRIEADSSFGALQKVSDEIGLLASNSIPAPYTWKDIEEADTIIDDDDSVWRIVDTHHLRPASTSIMFSLGLKR